jgi:hypothetical protein
VNQSDCTEIEGVSDSDTFQKTRKAMTVVGISDERQLEIFKLLAAVLHLGNWKKSACRSVPFACIDADTNGVGVVQADRTSPYRSRQRYFSATLS